MKELVEIIKESKADFVILGGDFNADPVVNKKRDDTERSHRYNGQLSKRNISKVGGKNIIIITKY